LNEMQRLRLSSFQRENMVESISLIVIPAKAGISSINPNR
jgi:hypothetical protein